VVTGDRPRRALRRRIPSGTQHSAFFEVETSTAHGNVRRLPTSTRRVQLAVQIA
jgi:hypothetical protein